MSRRGEPVPEAAPLVGLVLAFGIAGFGALFGTAETRLVAVAAALVVLYGFTAVGIVRSGDPADAIPPTPALVAGGVLAVVLAGYGLATSSPSLALAVAAVAAVPTALYHARYGEPMNPLDPELTLLAVGGLAALVAGLGLLTGQGPIGLATAVALVLAGLDYRRQRGGPLSDTARTRVVAGLFGGTLLGILGGIAAGEPTLGLVAGSVCLLLGAFFAVGR
ncbi:hypothetical protein [Halosegnis longus]|uniref:Uncharacterized protein n=1 Tax=Halosegnis longus TaxID=2216012 RepID=A0AAJ4R9X4_9EURY|nr:MULTISPECIES: hypothetical protein [Halobacteriales]RNJ27271.1 hypothetical protein Nmn1133_11660 [Salella cibi]